MYSIYIINAVKILQRIFLTYNMHYLQFLLVLLEHHLIFQVEEELAEQQNDNLLPENMDYLLATDFLNSIGL